MGFVYNRDSYFPSSDFLKRFYLLIFREKGREGEREKYQCVVASDASPLGTWPATRACALTRNQTGDPLVYKPALSPLNYTSQGPLLIFIPLYLGSLHWFNLA